MKAISRSTVLVVDDTPRNITLLRGVLAPAGYEVLEATDGPTALQLAQTAHPQLILLDVMMPGMDGYAVCAALKADESTRQIPVIFVTGKDDIEAEARCFALGAADYITKPIRIPVVLARVKTHMALYGQRRHLEGMFRDVMEFAPDAFILTDTKGHIVQINGQAEQLFGYGRAELLGVPLDTLIPGRTDPDLDAYREGLPAQRRPRVAVELSCRRQDGGEFPGEVNFSPLETNRGPLLMAVVRDVTQRREAEIALNESRQRLRALAAQNELMREEERKHIAREVHDELGQVLTSLRMDLSVLGMQHERLDPSLNDRIVEMKALVDRAIQGVRNVAGNLRPTTLDMGLVSAIDWLCVQFGERNSLPCKLHASDEQIALDEPRAVVVFRIVQESLTNISRYAQASRVDISLACTGNELHLEVRDNGKGFDPVAAGKTKTFGLLGMRERALALGGRMDIQSSPGHGTVIGVTIPLDPALAKDAA